MTLDDFAPGDILDFTQILSGEVEHRTAIVHSVNYNGTGLVTFSGYHVDDRMETGSGAFDPATVGTKPHGFYVAVRVIGKGRLPWQGRSWYPQPGNRGYDLMC